MRALLASSTVCINAIVKGWAKCGGQLLAGFIIGSDLLIDGGVIAAMCIDVLSVPD